MIQTIDRYGEAIEADLHSFFGLDLLDFFRGEHSFKKLGRLIGQIPQDPSRSRLALARLKDEDLAEAVVNRRGNGPEQDKYPGPPLELWTPISSQLALVVDRVSELTNVLLGVHGGKPRYSKPIPRPKTAFDIVEARRSYARHRSLVEEVEEARRRA